MNYTIIIFITYLFISSTHATENSNGPNMSILQNQPSFLIKIDTFGIRYILKLNGITVLRENGSDGQLSTTLPVNHWIHTSNNKIEVEVRPPNKGEEFNPHARLEYSLILKSNLDENLFHTLSTINITGLSANNSEEINSSPSGIFDSNNEFKISENGDIKVSDISVEKIPTFKGGLVYSRKIHAPSSIPLWKFFESDDLENYDILGDDEYYQKLNTLLAEYLKVQDAITNKNIEILKPLFMERNNELDKAFYRKPGETENTLFESLNDSASDKKLKLIDLDKLSVNFNVEKNGKLTRLLRPNWVPAIAFSIETGGSIRYDMYFRKKDGKWILTR